GRATRVVLSAGVHRRRSGARGRRCVLESRSMTRRFVSVLSTVGQLCRSYPQPARSTRVDSAAAPDGEGMSARRSAERTIRSRRQLMKTFSRRLRRDDSGMSTAEYAVGTVGACGLGGVLTKLAQSDWFGGLVKDIVGNITEWLPF